jgi:hypothetical protein
MLDCGQEFNVLRITLKFSLINRLNFSMPAHISFPRVGVAYSTYLDSTILPISISALGLIILLGQIIG